MKKFENGSPGNHGIKFDWSRMYDHGIPSLWQIYGLANVKMQAEIMTKLEITHGEDFGPHHTNVSEVL